MDEIADYNRRAWDAQVAAGNQWTVPVSAEEVARARKGEVSVVLTPHEPGPAAWLGDLRGKRVLGLASGGGQQMPLFAAAGAQVTVLDNSPAQLERDAQVAAREGLTLRTELGDMRDLSRFADGSFDLVFHPCSNTFVPDVNPVWREAARVLVPGGELLSGLVNPIVFMVPVEPPKQGPIPLLHGIPHDEARDLPPEQVAALVEKHDEIVKARVIAARDGEMDTMTVQIEANAGDEVTFGKSVIEVLKLKGRIEVVTPGALPKDGLVIEDQRSYD